MSNCFYATHNMIPTRWKQRAMITSVALIIVYCYLNVLLLLLYGRVLLFPKKIRHFSWEVLGNQFEFAAIQSIDIGIDMTRWFFFTPHQHAFDNAYTVLVARLRRRRRRRWRRWQRWRRWWWWWRWRYRCLENITQRGNRIWITTCDIRCTRY